MTRDLVLVTNVDLFDILSLALVNTDSLHTRSDPDVGVTEQETNLLEGLVLGLGEEEVRDDGVGDVGDHKDHEVLPSEDLGRSANCQSGLKRDTYIKTERGDLTDDDIVEPIGSCRSGRSHSSKVHGEDFGLVDPRDGTE